MAGCGNPRWVRRAEGWLWDDSPDWMPECVQRLALLALCRAVGHKAIDDQCGKPEHRYCYRCIKAMPT